MGNGKSDNVIPISGRKPAGQTDDLQLMRDQSLSRRRGFDTVDYAGPTTDVRHDDAAAQPLTAAILSRLFIESLDHQICGTRAPAFPKLCWPARSDAQLNRTSVDIVDMLFGFVLDDTALPESTREVLNRLQFQVMKMATSDPGFFWDWQHPARRLLARVAPIFVECRTRSGDIDHLEHLVNARLDRLMDDISAESRAFAVVLEDIERCAQELPQTREQNETAAWARAEEAARQILERCRTPLARDFLADYWLDVLQKTALDHDENSPQWLDALATIVELEWSITVKATQEDRFRLIALVPSLLARLNRGLDLVDVDKGERRLFFDTLVGLHSDMLRVEAPTPAPVARQESATEQVARIQRGDWVEFHLADGSSSRERLTWISPQRGILVFSNRHGQQAISISPEDLAEQVRERKALIIFDQPNPSSEKHSA